VIDARPGELVALHQRGSDSFELQWTRRCEAALSMDELEQRESERRREELLGVCGTLAEEGDILGRFREDLRARGFAGDTAGAELLYLVVTSRVLDRPVSAAPKAGSSAGKSFFVMAVLAFFPDAAYYVLSAMSEKALVYFKEPLKHRHLVIQEAEGLGNEVSQSLIRQLLSEGHLRYLVTVWNDDDPRAVELEIEGPTGLIVTTTRPRLHDENETRLVSMTVDESPEQTKAIYYALADEGEREVDLEAWHALQEFIALGDVRVTIPFGRLLARLVPPAAVRMRRYFGVLLSLVRAHALLHQETRESDGQGRLIATPDDYDVVRGLMAGLLSEHVEQAVPSEVRRTVDKARSLYDQARAEAAANGWNDAHNEPYVTVTQLANELERDKATVRRHVDRALDAGYLRDLSGGGRGRTKRLVPDEPMPADQELLPTVEQLEESRTRACAGGGIEGVSPRGAVRMTHRPVSRPGRSAADMGGPHSQSRMRERAIQVTRNCAAALATLFF